MRNKANPASTMPAPEILASSGRDELNIAEFPIALLTDRPPDGLNTISFSDRMVDRGEAITRTVTVEGTAKYGLPMPFDMDILLCLMQLTKAANDFTDPQVFFSRGDILKLMRLADSGTNYARLDDSLRRWHGVSLFYNQSWWDREENCWTSQEGIHIFEHLHLVTRKSPRRGKYQNQLELFRCSITWNAIFFKSCQAKNVKFLDMDKYFSLERAISRQMFRFLDKRFYRGPSWSFDLREFAFEHIGISRNYDTGQIKSKLRPAVEELEAIGFLEPLPASERYQKDGKEWTIRLIQKGGQSPAPADPHESALPPALPVPSPLEAALIRHGIHPPHAAELARQHDAGHIQTMIEYLEFEEAKKPGKIGDQAAWLYTAIRDGRSKPKGFISSDERRRQEEEEKAKAREAAELARRKRREEAAEKAENEEIAAYRKELTPEKLARHEADALAAASEETRQSLDAPHMKKFRQTQIKMLTDEHIRQILRSRKERS